MDIEKKEKLGEKSFTIVEIIVVIFIVGILAQLVITGMKIVMEKAYYGRATEELSQFARALTLYAEDHGGVFPDDVSRDLPSGLESYLTTNPQWPKAPWPGSVYDWDNWSNPSYPPQEQVYQISVRFCPLNPVGSTEFCNFPKLPWAEGFDYWSSMYFCISGPCRSHADKPLNHPGYCVNCQQ